MTALYYRVYNFFLRLFLGGDHVCECSCGSHHAYHVVPFNGVLSVVDTRGSYFGSNLMTKQEMDVIAGLLLGLCISWFLLWIDGVWKQVLKLWRANKLGDICFWSWMPKFKNTMDLFRQLQAKHTEDSSMC